MQKGVVSNLNKIRCSMLDFYFDPNAIADLRKRYQHDKIDSILEKYWKYSNSIDEIMDQIETLRNEKKSPPEKFIT